MKTNTFSVNNSKNLFASIFNDMFAQNVKWCFMTLSLSLFHFIFSDVPTQMPPLTPGTNKKLTEVLNASFASWEKEVQTFKITKGK